MSPQGSDTRSAGREGSRVPSATRGERQRESRRQQRRRLLPLLVVGAAVVLIVGGLVAWSLRSPSTATTAAPRPPSTSPSTTTTTAPAYLPPAVATTIAPPLAGEGHWAVADSWSAGPPAVMTTTFRPDPTQPTITAYVTWMRSATTQLALYPGYEGPGSTPLNRGPEMVPQSAWPNLLAAFNSGFYESDASAGFYTHGTLYFPMVNGLATVVSYTDGTVDIVDWQGGPTPGPDILMARQNLPLLVDAGAATAAAAVPSQWGVTLGGVPAVWRTGLGVDAKGNLLYVAASDQTAAGLAQILIDVGAVRGMQLDINPEWPIFVTYGGAGAVSPTLFVPNPNQIPNRFLYSSTKDFFALFQRLPGDLDQPW